MNKKITSYSHILGFVIQRLREEKNISQQNLAKELNVTRATVSKIENGQSEITTPIYLKLREIFRNDIFRLADEEKKILEAQGFTVYNSLKEVPVELRKNKGKDSAIKFFAGAATLAAVLMLLRK